MNSSQPEITASTISDTFGEKHFLFAGEIIRYGKKETFISIFDFKNDKYHHIHSKIIKEASDSIKKLICCGKDKQGADIIAAFTNQSMVITSFSKKKLSIVRRVNSLHDGKIQACIFFNRKVVTCSDKGEIKITRVMRREANAMDNTLTELK